MVAPLTADRVPTGIKIGVFILPCGVERVPARALLSVFSRVKESISESLESRIKILEIKRNFIIFPCEERGTPEGIFKELELKIKNTDSIIQKTLKNPKKPLQKTKKYDRIEESLYFSDQFNMNRKQIQQRILFITWLLKNPDLVNTLTKTLPLFSEKELQQLLGFLESGQEEIIYKLLKEKIEEYQSLIENIKILRGKVEREKIWIQEQKEQNKERVWLNSLFLL